MFKFTKELFLNATIMVAFISLGNHLYREKIATISSSMQRKLITGAVAGLLGCLLMVFSVNIQPDLYVDLRNLPIIMMALYTTFPSTIITSIVIGIFRIVHFGINISSVTALISAILVGLVCGCIGKIKVSITIKWILSVITMFIISGIAFLFLIKDLLLLRDVLVAYCGITIAASFILYFLLENITASNKSFFQMKDDAKKDFLTGLNNVRQFSLLLNNAVKEAKEKNENLSFILIDVDLFKNVNDTYGHNDGDLVIKQISDILNRTCRSFDIISRNGGEEFSVILLGCPLNRAIEVAERIRRNIGQHSFIISSGIEIKMTVSIGVSSYSESILDADQLVKCADLALYNAKENGRNTVSNASQ